MKSIIEKLKNNRLTKILLADIVRKKDKELFFENFSMMISSGIDIVVALKLLKSESKSRGIKKNNRRNTKQCWKWYNNI